MKTAGYVIVNLETQEIVSSGRTERLAWSQLPILNSEERDARGGTFLLRAEYLVLPATARLIGDAKKNPKCPYRKNRHVACTPAELQPAMDACPCGKKTIGDCYGQGICAFMFPAEIPVDFNEANTATTRLPRRETPGTVEPQPQSTIPRRNLRVCAASESARNSDPATSDAERPGLRVLRPSAAGKPMMASKRALETIA